MAERSRAEVTSAFTPVHTSVRALLQEHRRSSSGTLLEHDLARGVHTTLGRFSKVKKILNSEAKNLQELRV